MGSSDRSRTSLLCTASAYNVALNERTRRYSLVGGGGVGEESIGILDVPWAMTSGSRCGSAGAQIPLESIQKRAKGRGLLEVFRLHGVYPGLEVDNVKVGFPLLFHETLDFLFQVQKLFGGGHRRQGGFGNLGRQERPVC